MPQPKKIKKKIKKKMSVAYECHNPKKKKKKQKKVKSGGLCVPQTRVHCDAHADLKSNMAEARIRNIDWKDDMDLRNDLAKFVRVNLRRLEISDFMGKDYSMYAWSLRSLARRMQYFGIQFTDHDVEVNEVEDAVRKEISAFASNYLVQKRQTLGIFLF